MSPDSCKYNARVIVFKKKYFKKIAERDAIDQLVHCMISLSSLLLTIFFQSLCHAWTSQLVCIGLIETVTLGQVQTCLEISISDVDCLLIISF